MRKLLTAIIIMAAIALGAFGIYKVFNKTSVSNLPASKDTEIVDVANGSKYDVTLSQIKKNIAGREYSLFAYNGSFPGPTLRVKQGSSITLNVKNELSEATLLHPHGVRVENGADGTHLTQADIEPGANFEQKLTFPDPGIYWYHPHLREDKQQDLGLYGAILVEPSDDNYWNKVNQEDVLFLDDIEITDNKLPNYDEVTKTLMGRFGNTMLVNGKTDFELTAKQGEIVRLFMANAASTRVFNVAVKGLQQKLVGDDGGVVEKETKVESVVISPSERKTLEVLADKPGVYEITHTTPEKIYKLGTLRVTDEKAETSYAKEFATLRTNKDLAALHAALSDDIERASDINARLSISMMDKAMPSGGHGDHGSSSSAPSMSGCDEMGNCGSESDEEEPVPDPIEWEDVMGEANTNSTTKNVTWKVIDEATQKENDDIEWKFKVGDKVKIEIMNDPQSLHPMQHPIHLHGQRFLVLQENDKLNNNYAWKDTVLVPTGSAMTILVDVTNPGKWMLHCHIPEHMEAGMMVPFEVES